MEERWERMIVLTHRDANNIVIETWTIEYKEDEEPVVEPVQQQMESVLEPGHTPQKCYEQPILEALAFFGGSAHMESVCYRVYETVKDKLLQGDYELVWTGKGRKWSEPRWRNNVRWARKVMVNDGRLKSNSPYGIWELS
jgi:restriction system protein